MQFVKKNGLRLINGGYLVESKSENPIYHRGFVNAQKQAHTLGMLAERVKSSNFESVKVDSISKILQEVLEKEESSRIVKYESELNLVKTPTVDKLQKEALDWLNGNKNVEISQKINTLMQSFNIIGEFEEFGLYFDTNEIVKLNHIYTIDEIVKFAEIVAPHVDKI